jgi:hypothetical protein
VTRLWISSAVDSTFSYIAICFDFADELDVVDEDLLVELVLEVLEVDDNLLLKSLLVRLLLAALRFLALTREFLALLILISFLLSDYYIFMYYIG